MEAIIIFTIVIFWIWALRLIAVKIEDLEKENRELRASNRELLDANYKLTKK